MCIRKTTDRGRAAFTLMELLLAIAILAVVSTITYLTFSTAISAWKRGLALSDDLHHGEFVMDQLVMALRSAYYPDAAGDRGAAYGMVTEDLGDGEYARDRISWVKLGGALVGKDRPFIGSPHRVLVSIEADGDVSGVGVRAWQLHGQPDTFDPEQLDPQILSRLVRGFNCRTAYRKVGDEIDWMDEWEETNRLPTIVELSLYLEPLDEGDDPVEIKRVVGIPVAPLSWR